MNHSDILGLESLREIGMKQQQISMQIGSHAFENPTALESGGNPQTKPSLSTPKCSSLPGTLTRTGKLSKASIATSTSAENCDPSNINYKHTTDKPWSTHQLFTDFSKLSIEESAPIIEAIWKPTQEELLKVTPKWATTGISSFYMNKPPELTQSLEREALRRCFKDSLDVQNLAMRDRSLKETMDLQNQTCTCFQNFHYHQNQAWNCFANRLNHQSQAWSCFRDSINHQSQTCSCSRDSINHQDYTRSSHPGELNVVEEFHEYWPCAFVSSPIFWTSSNGPMVSIIEIFLQPNTQLFTTTLQIEFMLAGNCPDQPRLCPRTHLDGRMPNPQLRSLGNNASSANSIPRNPESQAERSQMNTRHVDSRIKNVGKMNNGQTKKGSVSGNIPDPTKRPKRHLSKAERKGLKQAKKKLQTKSTIRK